MKNLCTALFALALAACGTATHSASTTDGASSETCAGNSVDDSCMNQENFAECQAREAECPGQVQVLESCPLQFACP